MPTSTAVKVKKPAARRATRAKKLPGVTAMNDVKPVAWTPSVCEACNTLPVGSVELASLLLVLVFSLTAVLFTSVYALRMEHSKVLRLEAEAQGYVVE